MNDQIFLDKGWNNEPLKELYPTQAHINHRTKWLEMLGNVLRMIRDVNGVPFAAVIRKRLISPPDNEDTARTRKRLRPPRPLRPPRSVPPPRPPPLPIAAT